MKYFLSSLGCSKQPWFSLSFSNNASKQHGLLSGCQQYSLCPMLKLFLLAISYHWTANHGNFKLQEFLWFIRVKVFCSSDLRSALLHYKLFPVLKPADSLIHTESYPVVPAGFRLYVLLLCLWVNFSSILYEKSKTTACEHDQDAHLAYLPAFSLFPQGKQADMNSWKTAYQLCYQENVLSCCPLYFFLKPIPSALPLCPHFDLPTIKAAISTAM